MTVHTFARTLPFATSVSVGSPIRVHRRAMVIVDLLVVLLAIMTTLVLGWGAGATLTEDWPRIALSLSLLIIWPLMMWTRQTTAVNLLGQGAEEYRRVLVASAWTLLMVAAVSYFIGTERGRWFLLGAMALGTMGLLVGRHVMRVALRALMAKGTPLHRVFVIAAPSRAQEIFANFEGKDTRYQQAGVWHLEGGQGDPDPTQIVSRALEVGADTILFAPLGTENTQWTRRLAWATENLDVALLVSPSLAEIAGPRLSVEPLEGMTFVRVGMPQFTGPARVAKRALDIFGASVGLIVLSPLMLLIAFLIRRDSAGPAIFKQVRAGIGDSTFECWKFRTMYTGADAERAALRKAQPGVINHEVNSLRDGQPATFKMASDPQDHTHRWLVAQVLHRRDPATDECAAGGNEPRGPASTSAGRR